MNSQLPARCWMLVAGCLLLSFQDQPAPSDPKQPTAEELFTKMCETLGGSETISCDFSSSQSLEETYLSTGSIRLKVGGKICITLNHSDDSTRITGNGDRITTVRHSAAKGRREEASDVPADMDLIGTLFAQGGIEVTLQALHASTADFTEILDLHSFELGAQESLEGRPTRVIRCISTGPRFLAGNITIWMDTETSLPCKRRIVVPEKREVTDNGATITRGLTVEETYSNWKLNAEIDDKEFEVE